MEKNGGFLIAFVLFSLAILTVTGLNLSAGSLAVSDSPDAVLSLDRREEGLVLTLFDSSYLMPHTVLEQLEQGGQRLWHTVRFLLPARVQTLLGASALLYYAVSSP